MKRIELIISPKGDCRLKTSGFAGSHCTEASRFLERALGTTSSEQLTSEYFEMQPDLRSHADVSSDPDRG
jgi:hypothetical protein